MKNTLGMKSTCFRYIRKVNVEKHRRREGKNKNKGGGAQIKKINNLTKKGWDEWQCQHKYKVMSAPLGSRVVGTAKSELKARGKIGKAVHKDRTDITKGKRKSHTRGDEWGTFRQLLYSFRAESFSSSCTIDHRKNSCFFFLERRGRLAIYK